MKDERVCYICGRKASKETKPGCWLDFWIAEGDFCGREECWGGALGKKERGEK